MVGAENGGGHARGDRGEAGGGGRYSFDGPPTSIMHAAYAGALEVVKSLVEVREWWNRRLIMREWCNR